MRVLAKVAIALLTAASPPHKPVQPVHKGISASDYATAVAGLDSCDDFVGRGGTLPDATGLLVEAISDTKGTTKDEFETTAQFSARQTEFWKSELGDPLHLIIRVPIPGYKVSYDADRAVTLVKYMVDWSVDHHEIEFFDHNLSKGHYVGTNAFGVQADVTSIRAVKGELAFPLGQIITEGGDVSNVFVIPMSPETARAFKAKPSLLLLASLESPYVDERSSYSGATIDEPLSLSLTRRNVHVRLRCGVFMSGPQAVSSNVVR
jgi:hypothetical protein